MIKKLCIFSGVLLFLTCLAGIVLAGVGTVADTVDDVTITVPAACTLATDEGEGNYYRESMMNGQYKDDIGDTGFTVSCNTEDSFAIYAIGFSGDEYGGTGMVSSNTATGDIATGTATSGDTSAWAMKLAAVSGTPMPTIDNDYNAFSVVPDKYTKVASIPTSMNPNSETKVKVYL